MSKTNIYILKLENNKYYVGKTDDLEKRKEAHINGTASSWTKKYKPISVEKIIPNASPFDEDKYTIEYMDKYGIDNVRGGVYVTEALDGLQRYTIKKQLWGANDCCTQCGRKGHFVKNCKATTDVNGENIYEEKPKILYQCDYCEKEYEDESECKKHERFCKTKKTKSIKTCFECDEIGHYSNECPNIKIKSIKKCFECNKTGHYSNECPNKVETFACQFCDKEFETQKGASYHENYYCKNKVEVFLCQYCNKEFDTLKGATFHENVHCSKKKNKSKANKCFTCGREGHYADDCYATRHVKGYEI